MELLQYARCKWLAKILYDYYIPYSINHRKNIQLAKLTDIEVIALMLFQTLLGMTVRTKFYRYLRNNKVIKLSKLPEESRFNRICNHAKGMIQIIRNHITKNEVHPYYSIIDSFPIPLCISVRRFRAKVLKNIANQGFNSTKQMHFYGLKGHFIISALGIILDYSITPASIHDVKVAKTLISSYSTRYILADKGYTSNNLKEWCLRHHEQIWTPPKKNQRKWTELDCRLFKVRRRVESVFAQLKRLFDVERNYGKSLMGFQSRLEQCLLTDTLLKLNLL